MGLLSYLIDKFESEIIIFITYAIFSIIFIVIIVKFNNFSGSGIFMLYNILGAKVFNFKFAKGPGLWWRKSSIESGKKCGVKPNNILISIVTVRQVYGIFSTNYIFDGKSNWILTPAEIDLIADETCFRVFDGVVGIASSDCVFGE